MKATDLLNVLNHLPGNTEVPDIEFEWCNGTIKASEFFGSPPPPDDPVTSDT